MKSSRSRELQCFTLNLSYWEIEVDWLTVEEE